MADPKDGVSKGVEGCTEAEEVEVGRIDRMDVLALAAAALPMLWSPVRKVHAYTRALLKFAEVVNTGKLGNACSRNAAGASVCANGVTRGYRPTRETVENKHARAPPQLSHDYSALLSTSVTTAEGPKASPKVRKCGRKMRGCVMLGAGGHL